MNTCGARFGLCSMLLGLHLASACSEDAREADADDGSVNDAGMSSDGSVRDAASTARDGAVPTCSEPIGSCPAQSIATWTVLLDAADFGTDARLIALGGQAVLVTLGGGSFRVALIDDNYEGVATTTYSSWAFPSETRAPVAISDGANRAGDKFLFVLACEEDRTNCALSRAEVSMGELSTWQTEDLPGEFVGRGLAFDAASEPAAICVYGSGLLCLDGTWQEAIAPDPELQLNHVAFSGRWSLAVGEQGRWFKREVDDDTGTLGAWQDQPAMGGAALTYASVARAGAVVLGEGELQSALGEQAQYFTCSPDDLLAFSLDDVAPGLAYAVTRNGEVLQHPPPRLGGEERFCSYEQLPAGTVLDVSRSYCWDSVNLRVLLEDVVFGQNLCLSVF